jgi:phospholipid/cholesterol/gamma-HCH transport system substrate-binding protein
MRNLRIGLLVAAALAALMVTVLSLGQEQRFWERKVQYEVHFARTNGLQKGAPVSLTGVTIGSVADMRFPPDPAAAYIQVLINVNGDVTARIREDSVATIRTYGLLGDRYIELTTGSSDRAAIPAGGLIQSADPTDYEAMLGQSGDIVTNIVEVTSQLKDVLGTIQRGEGLLGAMLKNREVAEPTLQDFQKTMANVQATTRSLEEILARVNRGEGLAGFLMRDTKESERLIANLSRSAKALDDVTTRIGRGRGLLFQLAEDEAYAKRVLGNLDRTTANLAVVSDKLARGDGTLGKLVNDPGLYQDARGLIGRARQSWLLRLLGAGGGKGEPVPPPDAGGGPTQ